MSVSWSRPVVYVLLVALIVTGFYFAFRPQPISVDIAEVTRGPITVTVDEEGVTQVREIYMVSAPVAGRIRRSPLKVGDAVTAKTSVVARIEPVAPAFLDARARKSARAAVRAAEAFAELAAAQVKRARAELDFAQTDLQRSERLAKRGTISERSLDQANLEVKTRHAAHRSAEAQLEVRRQELYSAKAKLIEPDDISVSGSAPCCIQVYSPVSGRVLEIIHESEKVIAAGTSLVEIGDPHDLEIVVDLLSSDAVRVRQGAAANIEGWGGAVLNARVRRIEPTGFLKVSALGIEEQRVKVRLDLADAQDKWTRLGHDYRVLVRIEIWRADDALIVPLSALFRKGVSWAVFRVEDGTIHLTEIEIGQRNTRIAEVKNGLAVGARVVLHPSDRLADGVRVVERSESDAATGN